MGLPIQINMDKAGVLHDHCIIDLKEAFCYYASMKSCVQVGAAERRLGQAL